MISYIIKLEDDIKTVVKTQVNLMKIHPVAHVTLLTYYLLML